MTNLFDSLLLLSNICDPTEFMTWLDSMKTFIQQHMYSSNEDVFEPHLLDILFGGAWITDKNDVVIYADTAISTLIGIPRDKIIGNEICNGFQINTFQYFIPFYLKAKNDRCPIQYGPIPVRTPEGRLNHQATGWFIPRYNAEQFNGKICSGQHRKRIKRSGLFRGQMAGDMRVHP